MAGGGQQRTHTQTSFVIMSNRAAHALFKFGRLGTEDAAGPHEPLTRGRTRGASAGARGAAACSESGARAAAGASPERLRCRVTAATLVGPRCRRHSAAGDETAD